MESNDTSSAETEKPELYGLLFLPGFLIGFVTATIILLALPKLYSFIFRKLRCQKCLGSQASILENEECIHKVPEIEVTRSSDYSEIDDKKTGTNAHSRGITGANNDTMLRYEKYKVKKEIHKYSDLVDGTSGSRAKHNESSNNSYEPFSPGNIAKKQEKSDESHGYFILEPGSDKRLPVKPIERKSEDLLPGHVYFILEPGTNRVKPLSQYIASDEAINPSTGDTGPIYFVLEPMTESNESETAPYAVHDIADNPSYFILEKTECYD